MKRRRKVILVVFLFFITGLGFTDETGRTTPTTAPTLPVLPRFPGFPSLPDSNNQTNRPVHEIEKYNLNVSGAFPNGDTRNNVANTITSAQYILYSNRTIALKLVFQNGPEYIYHLRNPRSKIEIGAGVFRETFDTVVQVGMEFLLEQYLSELYYNSNTITSLYLMGRNQVIVLLNFTKRT